MSEWNQTGHVLKKIMQQIDASPRGQLERYRRIWHDVAGEMLAKKSIVGAVHDGTWIIYTENSVWMQELFMKKKQFLKKINQVAGATTAQDIEFRVGRMPQEKTSVPNLTELPQEPLPPLSHEQEAWIEAQCDRIVIPELRKTITRMRKRQARLDAARRQSGWQPCMYCHELTDCQNRVCDRCHARIEQERERQLVRFLIRYPASQYEDVYRVMPVSEKEYEQARHYLIYRTLDLVWRRQETESEQWLLARLLTRLQGDALTTQHKDNLIQKLIRKKTENKSEKHEIGTKNG